MAVDSGEEKAIIISCDLTSINCLLASKIREKFALLTDEVDPKYIIFGATHTHTSVGYKAPKGFAVDILDEFLPEDKKYTKLVETDDSVIGPDEALEFLSDRISLAAKQTFIMQISCDALG